MDKVVMNVLLQHRDATYRFARLRLTNTDDIYFNHAVNGAKKHRMHDTYHARTHEVHLGKSAAYKGSVIHFKAPELVTAPVPFSTTTNLFSGFTRHAAKPTQRDVVIRYPDDATYPVMLVYLEPARSYMVRRYFQMILLPPETSVVSVQTKRFSPALDVTIVGVRTTASSFMVDFDARFTSRGFSKQLRSANRVGSSDYPA